MLMSDHPRAVNLAVACGRTHPHPKFPSIGRRSTVSVQAMAEGALPHQNLPLSVPSSFSPWLPVTLPRGPKRADDLWPNQYASVILLTKGRGS